MILKMMNNKIQWKRNKQLRRNNKKSKKTMINQIKLMNNQKL